MRQPLQSGVSLVEMMVAMTLGLVLLAGILNLFFNALRSSHNLVAGKQIDDELHATLDLITRDLRRAGALGNPLRQMESSALINPFVIDPISAYTGEAANSCMTFGYDYNGNGSADTGSTDERYGYRLRAGVVQMRVSGQACTANTTPAWNNVTTSSQVLVTSLQFIVTSVTNLHVTERLATVSIAGQLAGDSTVARSMSRSVRLRNDGYVP